MCTLGSSSNMPKALFTFEDTGVGERGGAGGGGGGWGGGLIKYVFSSIYSSIASPPPPPPFRKKIGTTSGTSKNATRLGASRSSSDRMRRIRPRESAEERRTGYRRTVAGFD